MADLFTFTSVVSLGATVLYGFVGLLAGFRFGKNLPRVEKWIIAWLVFDALIHFTLEGPFVFWSLVSTVAKSNHWTAEVWKEYGKADSRWLHSDPTIVSLEILTVVVDGTLCLLLVYAIVAQRFYRHILQLILCVCELYGGWMTFCPEWLTGSKALDTSNWVFLWLYLFFFNTLWVVIPFALVFHTWVDIRDNGISSESRTFGSRLKRPPLRQVFEPNSDTKDVAGRRKDQ